jgi:hypothetical protein
VVQAIPTYVMSCFKLPDSLCDHMESMINKFWWGSKQGERKIPWIAWNVMCKEKYDGGDGFQNSQRFQFSYVS